MGKRRSIAATACAADGSVGFRMSRLGTRLGESDYAGSQDLRGRIWGILVPRNTAEFEPKNIYQMLEAVEPCRSDSTVSSMEATVSPLADSDQCPSRTILQDDSPGLYP